MREELRYIIITAARNEAEFIGSIIESIIAQTITPLKWIVVSDGSTDRTDAVVSDYASTCPWIELMRMTERRARNFGGKAHAVNAAYDRIRDLEFDVLVVLDADITVDKNHFAYLLAKLAENPELGVVGTPFQEATGEIYDYRFVSIEHVSGACQVFRRACFEDINGYTPLPVGGVDHLAVVSARMKGWKTRTFTDIVSRHHRKMGSAEHGPCASWYRTGIKDYTIGGHPLWELARVGIQIFRRPYIVRGLALGAGYFGAMVRQVERPVPAEIQKFHREEQMSRLKNLLHRTPTSRSGRRQRSA